MTERTSICILLLYFALALPAVADFAAGQRAYDRRDYATALKEWRPLAEPGDVTDQVNLDVMYNQGHGFPQDLAEVRARWILAASRGSGDNRNEYGDGRELVAEQERCGDLFGAAALSHDHRRTEEIRNGAEKGDAKEQNLLAQRYWLGYRGLKDLAQAVHWYRKAADQGYAPAEFNLGWLYDNKYIGMPDYAEAARWYRRAADQGYALAQFNLGSMYDNGEGVNQCHTEAVHWYRKAAEQGLEEAQFNLGLKYESGEGVTRDCVEAARWFRRSAIQGFGKAQFSVGLKYKNGQGVVQDYIQAHMWMTLAAAHVNSADGKRYVAVRDAVAARMNPMQIAEAQRRAREWRPRKPAKSKATEVATRPNAITPDSSGTGFWVNREGHILTNHHVVDGCSTLSVRTLNGRQTVQVLAQDPKNDLALVGPAKLNHVPLAFSESQRLKLGQGIIAVGYPLQGLLASSLSLTTGTISAVAGLLDDTRMVQITAPVQPGNSGGPLLDQNGNVIGVVSSKLNSLKVASLLGDVPQNVNFALKGSVVRAFLDSSGVSYATSPSSVNLAATTIGEKAKAAVALIECWK